MELVSNMFMLASILIAMIWTFIKNRMYNDAFGFDVELRLYRA
jgi:hypothetical protein